MRKISDVQSQPPSSSHSPDGESGAAPQNVFVGWSQEVLTKWDDKTQYAVESAWTEYFKWLNLPEWTYEPGCFENDGVNVDYQHFEVLAAALNKVGFKRLLGRRGTAFVSNSAGLPPSTSGQSSVYGQPTIENVVLVRWTDQSWSDDWKNYLTEVGMKLPGWVYKHGTRKDINGKYQVGKYKDGNCGGRFTSSYRQLTKKLEKALRLAKFEKTASTKGKLTFTANHAPPVSGKTSAQSPISGQPGSGQSSAGKTAQSPASGQLGSTQSSKSAGTSPPSDTRMPQVGIDLKDVTKEERNAWNEYLPSLKIEGWKYGSGGSFEGTPDSSDDVLEAALKRVDHLEVQESFSKKKQLTFEATDWPPNVHSPPAPAMVSIALADRNPEVRTAWKKCLESLQITGWKYQPAGYFGTVGSHASYGDLTGVLENLGFEKRKRASGIRAWVAKEGLKPPSPQS